MKRTIQIAILALAVLTLGRSAHAQIISTTRPLSQEATQLQTELSDARKQRDDLRSRARIAGTDAAPAEAKRADDKVAELEKATSEAATPLSTFLTQAGLEGGGASPQVSIQAATLFFTGGKSRLYVRSTLPTEIAADDEESGGAADALKASLNDRVKATLNDPYGGLLYLAAGRVVAINDDPADPTRGWFLDLRGGAKFLQLPEAQDKTSYRVTPFLVSSLGLRLSQPMFSDPEGTAAGVRFEASATFVVNRVIDRSISSLFTADDNGNIALGATTGSFNVAIGLSIKDGVGITLNGTPWSSSNLDKRFVMGFALLK